MAFEVSTTTDAIEPTASATTTPSVLCVAFSPDGTRVASGSSDGTVKVWRTNAERLGVCEMTFEPGAAVNSVTWSPDSPLRIVAAADTALYVYNTENASAECERILRRVDDGGDSGATCQGHGSGAACQGHTGKVTCVTYSPDGKRIVSGSDDETVCVYNAESGKCTMTLRGHADAVTSVAYSPDGKWFASSSYDGSIRVYEGYSGKCVRILRGNLTSVAFSPDGTCMIAGSTEGFVRVWRTETDESVRVPFKNFRVVTSVTFFPDGERVAVGFDNTVCAVQIKNGYCQTLLTHSGSVTSVAISSDGKRVATASCDGVLIAEVV